MREHDSKKNQTEKGNTRDELVILLIAFKKAFHGFLPPGLVRDMKREQVKHDDNHTAQSIIYQSSPLFKSSTV